jgi:hypothetical protein
MSIIRLGIRMLFVDIYWNPAELFCEQRFKVDFALILGVHDQVRKRRGWGMCYQCLPSRGNSFQLHLSPVVENSGDFWIPVPFSAQTDEAFC